MVVKKKAVKKELEVVEESGAMAPPAVHGQSPVATAGQGISQLAPMIQAVMSGQINTEQLKDLQEIQAKHEANEARKLYTQAIAEFRKVAPIIKRDQDVAFKDTKYSHSSLGYTAATINPLLADFGLSYCWKQKQEGNFITVKCILTHAAGHSESTSLTAAPDTSGGKNSIQAIGSANSYLERYTLFALLGLASADDDDDGYASGPAIPEIEFITEDQEVQIRDMIEATGSNKAKFLKWLQADTVSDIRLSDFDKAYNALLKKQK